MGRGRIKSSILLLLSTLLPLDGVRCAQKSAPVIIAFGTWQPPALSKYITPSKIHPDYELVRGVAMKLEFSSAWWSCGEVATTARVWCATNSTRNIQSCRLILGRTDLIGYFSSYHGGTNVQTNYKWQAGEKNSKVRDCGTNAMIGLALTNGAPFPKSTRDWANQIILRQSDWFYKSIKQIMNNRGVDLKATW